MPDLTPEQLNQKLESLLKSKVNLRLNQNRSTYLSCKLFAGSVYKISLHHNFLNAPDSVLEALVRYLQKGSRDDAEIMREFVSSRDIPEHENSSHANKPKPLNPIGKTFDLRKMAEKLNRKYFQGDLKFTIGWNPKRPPTSRSAKPKSVLLGRCYPNTKSITIHQLLDHPQMPEFFVAFVVYHEMCHLVVPITKTATGRNQIHTPEFKLMESEFEDFMKCKVFEKKKLPRFLKMWHNGKYYQMNYELQLKSAISKLMKSVRKEESALKPKKVSPKIPKPIERPQKPDTDEPDDEQLSLF